MITLFCDKFSCARHAINSHRCAYDGELSVDILAGDDDGPMCYVDILSTPEYQSEFWKSCRDKTTGEKYRVRAKGKRIEVKGFVLYVQEKIPPEEEWGNIFSGFDTTEEKTGTLLPVNRLYNEEALSRIRELWTDADDVLDLPIREENENEPE